MTAPTNPYQPTPAEPTPAPPTGAQQANANPKKPKKQKAVKRERTPAEILRQRAFITGIAVAVAVLACAWGLYATFDANEKIDALSADATPTLVAATDIKKGAVITAEDLEVRDVPNAVRVSAALDESALSGDSSMIGRVAVTDISAGTQMTDSLATGKGSTVSLADALGVGKQAVTIAVNDESGMANLLRVGDIVRVVTMTGSIGGDVVAKDIAANARIIALDSHLTDDGNSYATVTVEVTPTEADGIRGAQASTGVTLILRAASDASDTANAAAEVEIVVEEDTTEAA